jgi:hypothetical protein
MPSCLYGNVIGGLYAKIKELNISRKKYVQLVFKTNIIDA